VFGAGVQDLHYGLKQARFRVFDVQVNGRFLPAEQVAELTKELDLEYVPILYVGAYDEGILRTLRDGKDTLSQSHIREGIVIRSSHETMHPVHGRKIAKWVSPDYLTRKAKNATEFN
jgi:RNA ligase (TIGR02306 family)